MGIKIATDMKLGQIEIKNAKLEFMAKWFDDQHEEFIQKAILVHRSAVFRILRKIIKTCPVDTGRLRGSFLPFLDKHGVGGSATKIIQDDTEANYPRDTPKGEFSQASVQEGRQLGEFIDDVLSTFIATNVNYAMQAEKRTGFVGRALVWGQKRYNKAFDDFFDAAYRQGMIPEKYDPEAEGPD